MAGDDLLGLNRCWPVRNRLRNPYSPVSNTSTGAGYELCGKRVGSFFWGEGPWNWIFGGYSRDVPQGW